MKKIKNLIYKVVVNIIGRALWDALKDHFNSPL